MTSAIYGHSLTPAALADEKGNVVVVQHCASPQSLERLLRPVSLPFLLTMTAAPLQHLERKPPTLCLPTIS